MTPAQHAKRIAELVGQSAPEIVSAIEREISAAIESATHAAADRQSTRAIDTELRAKIELLELQQAAINELAVPVIEVWDGVLTLPLVGLLDTQRTADAMDRVLEAVATTHAKVIIVDVTGIDTVDTMTADHFLKLARAVKLLGADMYLTGIRPAIAQTIVALGTTVTDIRTFGSLKAGLKAAIVSLTTRVSGANPTANR